MAKQDDPINEIEEDLDETEEEEEEDEDDDFDDEEGENPNPQLDKAKMEKVFHKISTERVPLRVHDVTIKGNTKTKDSLIESLIQNLKSATSVQELLQAASVANARLQKLDIFDSVNITLDSGPSELPGTTNVVVEVVESRNPLTGDIGIFTKPEVVIFYIARYDCYLGIFSF